LKGRPPTEFLPKFFLQEGFLRYQAAGRMQGLEDCIPPIHTKKEKESG